MAFTDTTAKVTGGGAGNQIFLIRSHDPLFVSGVEELRATGFVPIQGAPVRDHALSDGASIDLAYSDALGLFVMGINGEQSAQSGVRFFDPTTFAKVGSVFIPFPWAEGPGLNRRPDGHLDPSVSCDRAAIDFMSASGPGIPDWDLGHGGADLVTGQSCSCVDWAAVLEGSLIGATDRPLALIIGGQRLQFASTAPALLLARTSLTVPVSTYDSIPYGASLHQGDKVIGAPGLPGAFLLDDGRRWPVSCLELVTAAGSSITSVSAAEYSSHPAGPSLFCIK